MSIQSLQHTCIPLGCALGIFVLPNEMEQILAGAKQSGENEKARLIEEGDKLKARILEQAKTNIDYEVKRAKESIKEEAVEIAMELAEKKLREKQETR